MIAVCVTLTLHPDQMTPFLEALRAHGSRCLAREPGCQRFDICTGPADQLFIYELYTDQAAFDAHLETEHFKTFDAHVSPWVADKVVTLWDYVDTRMPQTDI